MIRNSVDIERVLEVLNRAVEADRKALTKLVETRVDCNDQLSMDPEVQVALRLEATPQVGFLGLLNGIFGEQDGWGAFCAMYELKCSQDSGHDIGEDLVESDECPVCGAEVILGDLIEFQKSPEVL